MTNRYPIDRFKAEIAAMPLDVECDEEGNLEFINVWMQLKLAARLECICLNYDVDPLPDDYQEVLHFSSIISGERLHSPLLEAREVLRITEGLDGLRGEDAHWVKSFQKYTDTLEWELDNFEGEQLAHAIIASQDLACLRYLDQWLYEDSDEPGFFEEVYPCIERLMEKCEAEVLDDDVYPLIRGYSDAFPISMAVAFECVKCPSSDGQTLTLLGRLVRPEHYLTKAGVHTANHFLSYIHKHGRTPSGEALSDYGPVDDLMKFTGLPKADAHRIVVAQAAGRDAQEGGTP